MLTFSNIFRPFLASNSAMSCGVVTITEPLTTPTVAKDPDGRIAQIYKEIAKKVSAKLTQQDKALSSFPSITIE
jgi:hypothetical protein